MAVIDRLGFSRDAAQIVAYSCVGGHFGTGGMMAGDAFGAADRRSLQGHAFIITAARTTLLSSLLLAVTPASSWAQNLILNPGFETGDLTDWTTTGFVDVEHGGSFGIPAHSGSYYANPWNTGGTLSQTVGIGESGRYEFSFFYATEAGETWNLTATLNGATIFDATVATNASYVESSSAVKLSTGSASVEFDAVSVSGPGEFAIDDVSLEYLGPNALTPLLPANAPTNQVNVTEAIDAFTNAGGTLPSGFAGLYNLTPAGLAAAAAELSGEAATGAEGDAFQMMDQFLSVMLDPFVDGRGASGAFGAGAGADATADTGTTSSTALAYTDEAQSASPAQMAIASLPVTKEPPALVYAPRWSAWASGYGGLGSTQGSASVGSNQVSADVYGSAAGLDYHVTPNTVVGLALAGAGMGWDLANGLGSGNGDAFQAGLYGTTRIGQLYIAGAFGFADHWLNTNRSALGDNLTANFDAQSYGGRLEAGYRIPLVLPIALPIVPTGPMEIAPYAAVQPQVFHTPAYSETDLSGAGLGLSYNAANATDVRSELGFRADALFHIDDGMALDLFSRTAWAHDFLSTPTLAAVFETLPGASFTVYGATPPRNSALLTSGAELRLTPALYILAKVDSELAPGSQTYAGTGTIRYVW